MPSHFPWLQETERTTDSQSWLVTYSDVLSLLLIFFIVWFSVSEINENGKFESLTQALHSQFGPTSEKQTNTTELFNKNYATNAVGAGRALQQELLQKNPIFQTASALAEKNHPSSKTVPCGLLAFHENESQLSSQHRLALQKAIAQHPSGTFTLDLHCYSANAASEKYANVSKWNMAFLRGCAARDYLAHLGVDPANIRVTLDSNNQKASSETDRPLMSGVSSVELFLTPTAVVAANPTLIR